ncbi:putative secreted protein [Wickerhamomyces ciferrii]|uniref:Secreted protein n=1 Tax=Wickerhamomyces ciferrii (strain ATCC 14091 / BCRC 22168 / CBS 111 / JCM 3599 / NBRC 0793 / NRRL Y-1031 F-60-10) TaxID=1206466 RepID=K0KZH7_WICCF|nr:uncharacterized protein BN7_6131 [Wickerhamomyces ciferrii]CCH46538.1 putative secreted protein [Wickerhamomyces ciferrii]
MKLSTLVIEGLLFSGIIALPANAGPKLCFDANKSEYCVGGNAKKCYEVYGSQTDIGKKPVENFCNFWCSKIKSPNECKTNKKKFNYHPNFACDKTQYC